MSRRPPTCGHANLYGVFTDLALRWTAPRGVIASVTSTSFLAGEYFKARRGVFEDVLQETLLATWRRGGGARPAAVHCS
jgi:adenine-specific DNA-methyltransferase